MPYLGIFALAFKKLLPYLKSAPSNLLNCEISRENKIAKICDQRCFYLGILGVEF